MRAIAMGGEIDEIDSACAPLRSLIDRGAVEARDAWHDAWFRAAARLDQMGKGDEGRGATISAGRKLLRSSAYYMIAEQALSPSDRRKSFTYSKLLKTFRRGIELRGDPVEFIDIPVEGSLLPALFVTPDRTAGPWPCVIFFNGLDSQKELAYFFNAGLSARSLAMLFVDQPGTGGALRLAGLAARHDTEVVARACVDYLQARREIDDTRIAILGMSLGGYYAPRAAAFETRLRACVAWGAIWDWAEAARAIRDRAGREQLAWVFGTADESKLERRLSNFNLIDVAGRIRCPFLIVHGERDRQIPVEHARKVFAAATGSIRRELKVFTKAEGGAEHCQMDARTLATDHIHDWLADVLDGTR